jgi:hypothetical protein
MCGVCVDGFEAWHHQHQFAPIAQSILDFLMLAKYCE